VIINATKIGFPQVIFAAKLDSSPLVDPYSEPPWQVSLMSDDIASLRNNFVD